MRESASTKLFNLFRSNPTNVRTPTSESDSPTASPSPNGNSPYNMSPWNPTAFPSAATSPTGLIGSLTREQGHLYSLATSADLLYTGSDSKNIRVWKRLDEFSGFKAGSGLVKAIVISGDRIFTGHQDGKIRIWKASDKDCSLYKRVGTLPRLKDFLRSSVNPSSYVPVRRHRNAVWLRHFDAVSCMAIDADAGILYSGSWDKTVKVWRIGDSKCLESVTAHDDAINTVAVGFGFVFTGSADGTVKVWRRESAKHVLVKVLLRRESAVTALAVSVEAGVVYCGSSDGVVDYWERGPRLVHGGVLRGHKLAVLCLVTAGRLVISGSADRTIRVWRREDAGGGVHTRLSVLTGHAGPVKCLAVGDESGGGPGWVLYSGSLDKSVKVWHVSEERTAETDMTKTPPHVHADVAGLIGMSRWRV